MLFTCTKENLARALSVVSGVAGRGGNLPILQNIAIHAHESNVELVGTDLEVALRGFVRAKVDKTGSFTVPAKTLQEVVGVLADTNITIEAKDGGLQVSAGSTSTHIKGVGTDDFPVIPEVQEEKHYLLDAVSFKQALSQVLVAVARNEIRPELAGVYMGLFTDRHNGMILAATDSYRLAEKKVSVKQGDEEHVCIVPAKTIGEMIRILGLVKLGASEHDARLWVSENQIALRFDQFEMTSRLVDGKYPDYAQIIPDKFATTSVFPVDEAVKHIKGAAVFTTTGMNAVSFDVNASQNSVAVSSTSAQTGAYSAEIDADVTGEENSILLNHRYVYDGLNHMSGPVAFEVNSAEMPCMFHPIEDDSYKYIVMPIRQ